MPKDRYNWSQQPNGRWTLKSLSVFATCKKKGREYGDEFLKKDAEAANNEEKISGYCAPVHFKHTDKNGEPVTEYRIGRMSNRRIFEVPVGKDIKPGTVVDILDVSANTKDLLEQGVLGPRSVEISPDRESGLRRIRSLAFLGATVPFHRLAERSEAEPENYKFSAELPDGTEWVKFENLDPSYDSMTNSGANNMNPIDMGGQRPPMENGAGEGQIMAVLNQIIQSQQAQTQAIAQIAVAMATQSAAPAAAPPAAAPPAEEAPPMEEEAPKEEEAPPMGEEAPKEEAPPMANGNGNGNMNGNGNGNMNGNGNGDKPPFEKPGGFTRMSEEINEMDDKIRDQLIEAHAARAKAEASAATSIEKLSDDSVDVDQFLELQLSKGMAFDRAVEKKAIGAIGFDAWKKHVFVHFSEAPLESTQPNSTRFSDPVATTVKTNFSDIPEALRGTKNADVARKHGQEYDLYVEEHGIPPCEGSRDDYIQFCVERKQPVEQF
jgi:hypothetical protein